MKATPLPDPLLSVVMPVYNEESTIEEIVSRVLAVPLRVELLVVDDGSTDRSREILGELAEKRGFKPHLWASPIWFCSTSCCPS